MNQKVLFFLLIFVISAFAKSGRIAGGEIAPDLRFRYHVKVEPSIGSFRRLCGGALIRYNWVITVAQCIYNARDVIIRLGVIDRLLGPEAAFFWVRDREDMYVHEDFSDTDITSDIGLIYLRDATEDLLDITNEDGTKLILTIALPPNENINIDDIPGVVTGFGFTGDGDNALKSMKLLFAVMRTITLEACREHHGTSLITNGNFCTDTTDGRSTCIGDEGGPFVTVFNFIPTVIGLASTTFQHCTVGHPAIFINLMSFYDWIHKIIDKPSIETTVSPPTPPPGNGNRCRCDCLCETCPPFPPILPFDSEPKSNSFWKK